MSIDAKTASMAYRPHRYNVLNDAVMNVRLFHVITDSPTADKPVNISSARKVLRVRLQREEIGELEEAMFNDDLTKVADGIADAMFVLIGTALEYGIPISYVFSLVCDANMKKADPETGKVLKDPMGKVLKPAGWEPPDGQIAMAIQNLIDVDEITRRTTSVKEG